jgi:hypothetical protein
MRRGAAAALAFTVATLSLIVCMGIAFAVGRFPNLISRAGARPPVQVNWNGFWVVTDS